MYDQNNNSLYKYSILNIHYDLELQHSETTLDGALNFINSCVFAMDILWYKHAELLVFKISSLFISLKKLKSAILYEILNCIKSCNLMWTLG